jgi:2-amino-4-hydroxy-6-hydroxymethyldihydropteridine diphosphokinase
VDHVRRVVIGLGSNLGDRPNTIRAAVEALRADRALSVLRLSPLYESPPAGGPPQGDYVNAAVLIATSLPVRELLDCALAVERSLGRTRPDPVRCAPRTIDLDLLWIEGESVSEPDLVVPHPRLRERVFALRPLLDLAPDACDPDSSEPYASLAEARAPLRRFDER